MGTNGTKISTENSNGNSWKFRDTSQASGNSGKCCSIRHLEIFGNSKLEFFIEWKSLTLNYGDEANIVKKESWALTIRPKMSGRISGNFHGTVFFQCGRRQLRAWNFLMTSRVKSQIDCGSKQNTDKSTSWLFIDHNNRGLAQTTSAAKTSQNKGFSDSYNGSALVINLCTFRNQPM